MAIFSGSRARALALCVFLLLGIVSAQAACYWPSGAPSTPDYRACNGTTAESACCAGADSCTTEGMCLSREGYIYRGGCTDKAWRSGSCPRYCTNVRREVWTGIWSCSSAPNNGTMFFSWCCGDLESCCENAIPREALDIGTAFAAGTDVILERLGGGDTDSADDTSSVPGAAASSTSPSNADATTLGSGGSPTADSGTLNPTCVATTNNVRTSLGAGLGVPLAVSLIALAVVSTLLWRERRRHRGTYPTKPGDDSASPDSAARAGAPPPMARHGAYGANAAAVGAGGAYAPRPSHEASPDRNGVSPGAEREAWHSRGGADSASVNRAASNRDRHGGAASRNGAGWYGGQGSDGASTSSRARGPESPNGGSDQNTLLSGGSHYPAELGGEHLTRAELWGSEKK